MSQVNSNSAPLNPQPQSRVLEFTQVLRFFNIIVAFGIIAFSIFCYVTFKIQDNVSFLDDPSLVVLPTIVILSGLIIVGVQFSIQLFVMNFRFMFHYIGRGLFNIYVGVICLAMIRSSSETLYKVVIYVAGGLMVLFGLFYIVIALCCCAQAQDIKKREPTQPREDQEGQGINQRNSTSNQG